MLTVTSLPPEPTRWCDACDAQGQARWEVTARTVSLLLCNAHLVTLSIIVPEAWQERGDDA